MCHGEFHKAGAGLGIVVGCPYVVQSASSGRDPKTPQHGTGTTRPTGGLAREVKAKKRTCRHETMSRLHAAEPVLLENWIRDSSAFLRYLQLILRMSSARVASSRQVLPPAGNGGASRGSKAWCSCRSRGQDFALCPTARQILTRSYLVTRQTAARLDHHASNSHALWLLCMLCTHRVGNLFSKCQWLKSPMRVCAVLTEPIDVS